MHLPMFLVKEAPAPSPLSLPRQWIENAGEEDQTFSAHSLNCHDPDTCSLRITHKVEYLGTAQPRVGNPTIQKLSSVTSVRLKQSNDPDETITMAQSCLLPVTNYLFEANIQIPTLHYCPIKLENGCTSPLASPTSVMQDFGAEQPQQRMQRLVKNGRTLCSVPDCGRVARGREGLCQRHLSPDKKPKCRKCHKNCPQVAGSLCVKCSGREYPKRNKGSRKRPLAAVLSPEQTVAPKRQFKDSLICSSPVTVKSELVRTPSTAALWDYLLTGCDDDFLAPCLSSIQNQQDVSSTSGLTSGLLSLPRAQGELEKSPFRVVELSQCEQPNLIDPDVNTDDSLLLFETIDDADLAEIAMSLVATSQCF